MIIPRQCSYCAASEARLAAFEELVAALRRDLDIAVESQLAAERELDLEKRKHAVTRTAFATFRWLLSDIVDKAAYGVVEPKP